MHRLTEPPDAGIGQRLGSALQRLSDSRDLSADLAPILDIAIEMTGAAMGTLQRFDAEKDCLELVASRGFSSEALRFFGVVRRDTNTSCAVAFTRRMRVFVEDISTSYLYVGTPELDMLSADGIAAVQSTPLISSRGRFWGVVSTHFRKKQMESVFDHGPLDRLAVQIADCLEKRERSGHHQYDASGLDGGKLT